MDSRDRADVSGDDWVVSLEVFNKQFFTLVFGTFKLLNHNMIKEKISSMYPIDGPEAKELSDVSYKMCPKDKYYMKEISGCISRICT